MNCKNLKIRSKNYEKKFYCALNKCFVDATACSCCKSKEYKEYKQLKRTAIKKKNYKVSRMAKSCDISNEVKQVVWERDLHRCIFCGKSVPLRNACCHFIPRSQGGLGIEQNIFTACDSCHHEQDNGKNTKDYDRLAEIHLFSCYPNWKKKDLIYRKYA